MSTMWPAQSSLICCPMRRKNGFSLPNWEDAARITVSRLPTMYRWIRFGKGGRMTLILSSGALLGVARRTLVLAEGELTAKPVKAVVEYLG